MPLRDYQIDLYNRVRQSLRDGYVQPLVVLPTGGGKGEIISKITADADAKKTSGVFLVERQEIVKGQSEKLTRWGIDHGILMGAESRDTHKRIQVASIATMRNRLSMLRRFRWAIADEAHGCVTEGWAKVFEALGHVPKIGFTATPWRLDRRGLKEAGFNQLIVGPSTRELIDMGYLIDYDYYEPSVPDLTGKPPHAGDYTDAELTDVMDNSRVIADVVKYYGKLGKGRPGVGFFVNRKHAEHQADRFRAEGFRCVAVDGTHGRNFTLEGSTRKWANRDAVWKDLSEGRLDYVCSVGIISVGWDCPPASYASLCRPTKSLALYLQQVGRVLRAVPGKPRAIIADHAGNKLRHGMPDMIHEWTLEGRKARNNGDGEIPPQFLPRVCPDCKKVSPAQTKVCPGCGYQFTYTPEVEHATGELTLVDKADLNPLNGYAGYLKGKTGDAAMVAIVEEASAKNWKNSAVWFRQKALSEARQEFRNIFGNPPDSTWNAVDIHATILKYKGI